MSIINGIVGFIVGILSALLLGIIEMKLLKRFQLEPLIPFVIGITVLASALTGIIIGIKIAKRKR